MYNMGTCNKAFKKPQKINKIKNKIDFYSERF